MTKALRRDFSEPPPILNAKYLQLGRGKFAIIDEEDFERASQHVWQAAHGVCKSDLWYAVTSFRETPSSKRRTIRLHQFIIGRAPKGLVIDHINGDGLDNRKSNLRICTQAENARNSTTKGAPRYIKASHSMSKIKDIVFIYHLVYLTPKEMLHWNIIG